MSAKPVLNNVEYQVSVIVPTYCERENLPILVPRISSEFEKAGIHGEILIVDDNSPDNTEQVCGELATKYPLRFEIRTDERGLSTAVIHGMRKARGEVFVVMDADMSHPPEQISELVRMIRSEEGDFAIGSRYVAGGGTEDNWGLFRWINSRVATLLAMPLTSARDPMSGFFAISRAKFESATHLNPVGYKIGLELIVKCDCRSVKEIPIFFANRVHGKSKLSIKEQINYLRHIKRLYEFRLGVFSQPAQFALVGTTGVVIDLTSLLLLLIILSPYWARALSIWTAMTWNFWLNRRLTFSYARTRPIAKQYVLFSFSCLLGAVVNWSIFAYLHSAVNFLAEWPLVTASLGIIGGSGLNFVMSKYVAFK
jgi:dolichol-phosphate mannosyltransferase